MTTFQDCAVLMTSVGPNRAKTVFLVRGLFGLSVAEAKRIVDATPVTFIIDGCGPDVAERVAHKLAEAGATLRATWESEALDNASFAWSCGHVHDLDID